MILLAIDTATSSGSVALVTESETLAEITLATGCTHSRHLMEMVDQCLGWAEIRFEDIDGFVVNRGPGSFTGLRIGISTVKGLAWACNKPVLGLCGLEALAFQTALDQRLICAMQDARRRQVYCGYYRMDHESLKQVGQIRAADPEQAVAGIEQPCIFVGGGALLYRDRLMRALGDLAHMAPAGHHMLHASTLGICGMARFADYSIDAAGLVPEYIRGSDARMPAALFR
jgi:tRNA threonylcarbamoyladenosine biosynthesis protein TsaB